MQREHASAEGSLREPLARSVRLLSFALSSAHPANVGPAGSRIVFLAAAAVPVVATYRASGVAAAASRLERHVFHRPEVGQCDPLPVGAPESEDAPVAVTAGRGGVSAVRSDLAEKPLEPLLRRLDVFPLG